MKVEAVEKEFINLTTAASLLERCEETVRRLVNDGHLTPHRVLGRRVFRRAEVVRLREQRDAGAQVLEASHS